MSATPSITMQPVTSSQIAAIGHCATLNLLAIQFPPKKSGVADTYRYQNVDATMFAEFLGAESQGSFFIQRIKKFPEQFPYTKLDPAALAVPAAAALIGPVPVARDAAGWWGHPGIPDFGEDVEAFKAWLAAQGLVTDYKSLESEDADHPAYVSYYDEESCSVAAWNPEAPAGEGWFTISIHDTEDGPYWLWARPLAARLSEDHALALAINAECYGEPLPGGQRYSRTTFKDNGYPILLDADGKRSVFCDLCV